MILFMSSTPCLYVMDINEHFKLMCLISRPYELSCLQHFDLGETNMIL